jgi:peptidoglycan hydrolase-like protein with peptidoglycan-binding domain
MLKRGSSGDGVSSLQRALGALGVDLAVDRSFGPKTERAVRDFQTRRGLEADGIVGPATKAAIAAALGGRPIPVPPSPTPPSRRSGKKLTPAQFIAAYGPMAKASEAKNGVPALVTLGQAATESGWGESAHVSTSSASRPKRPTQRICASYFGQRKSFPAQT